jgi:hypothetical protein
MPDAPALPATGTAFVDFVLRSAMTAAAADTDPAAGRILARLLAVVGAERGDEALAPYLAVIPGEDSTFQVRVFRAGDLNPTTVTDEDGPVAALKTALHLARDSDGGIEVLSRHRSAGLERCVLVRDSTGELEFRFPRAETMIGEPTACSAALQAWETTFEEWRRADGSETSGGVVLVPGRPAGPAAAPDEPAGHERRGADDGGLAELLEGFFSNLTIEVDLGQIEQLVKRAIDVDRHEIVQPVADRVAEVIGPMLLAQATRSDAAAPPAPPPVIVGVPTAREVAEVVSAEVGALLSETILGRHHGFAADQVPALRGMASSIERLEVQLEGVRDELRRSSTVLIGIDDRLEANDRRAALTERVLTSVDGEMQRLAHRIDDQVTSLVEGAEGGSELSDGVARLTRKLRQSVAQLDRALLRLDELFERAGADDATGPVLLRPPGRGEPPRQPRAAGPMAR